MGVGSEVYSALRVGRRGIGVELKPSYFRQAVKNIRSVGQRETTQLELITEPLVAEAAERIPKPAVIYRRLGR